MNTSKETESINEEGAKEIKVETVDYRSPAGEDKEAKKENVEITHIQQPKNDDKPAAGGVMAQTTAKVAETIQSAKEALSGTTHDDQTTHSEKSK